MNPIKNLASVIMGAGGLDQDQVQRLVWGWQGLAHPSEDRISTDSVARLLNGQPVPERDETIVYAALIALLPTIMDKRALQRAFFKHDKALNVLAAYGSLCTTSPWAFVRVWACDDLANFARELGLERRTLRRLEEARWRGGHVPAPMLDALADLGRRLARNAASLDKQGDLDRPCALEATA